MVICYIDFILVFLRFEDGFGEGMVGFKVFIVDLKIKWICYLFRDMFVFFIIIYKLDSVVR